MAEFVIHLRPGDRPVAFDLRLTLASDADALPHEHEHDHRRLVQQLLTGTRAEIHREKPAVEPVVG